MRCERCQHATHAKTCDCACHLMFSGLPTYIPNEQLTEEYIIARAFKLGATSIYTDLRPKFARAVVMEWPGIGLHSYPMERYGIGRWAQGFAGNLKSMRRFVENTGMELRWHEKESK